MLIGSRPRPQMQRTASITRITIEVDDDQTAGQDSDVAMTVVDGGDNYDQRFLGMLSPVNHRRNERKDGGRSSPSSLSSFLGNCGFCKRRLAPGRDIYMYKYVYILTTLLLTTLFLNYFSFLRYQFYFNTVFPIVIKDSIIYSSFSNASQSNIDIFVCNINKL